jgi:hypothetical protein
LKGRSRAFPGWFGGCMAALLLAGGCARLLGLSDDYREAEQPPDGQTVSEADGGGGGPDAQAEPDADAAAPDDGIPNVLPTGKLVYHRYTTYYTGDSEMFLVDLPAGTRSEELGARYGLCHMMNGIFSPDGKWLAVTAAPRGEGDCPGTERAALEVYVLDLEQPGVKRRLTDNDVPDEDPQFSARGDFLLFKHDGHIVEWPLGEPTFTGCDALPDNAYCFNSSELEQSKPVVTPDDKTICYYEDHEDDSDIYCFERALGHTGVDIVDIRKPAVVHFDVLDARPTIDDKHLYYIRARSVTNPVKYIARNSLGDLNGVGEDARFCTDEASDYIDPLSLGNDLIVYASNEAGEGGFDLFIARFNGEAVRALDDLVPELNSPKDDFGPAFWPAPAP